MKTVQRSLMEFLRRNSMVLTIITAAFIVIEGSIAWFYPSSWWKPLGLFAGLAVLVLVWSNIKVVIKVVVSIVAMIFLMAAAVITGSAYSGSSIGGSTWALSLAFCWACILTISYYTASSKSRWTAAILGAVIAFSSSYMLLPVRNMLIIMLAGFSIGLLSGVGFLKIGSLRVRSKRGLRVCQDDDMLIRSKKIMSSLWPDAEMHTIKITRHRYGGVWFGVGMPIVVILPLDLSEGLEEHKRRGFSYRGRFIKNNLQWLDSRIHLLVHRPEPVSLLLDSRSANIKTREDPGIISYPMLNSNHVGFFGLISVPKRDQQFKKMVGLCVSRFDGVQYCTDRDVKRLHRKMTRKHLSDIFTIRTTNKPKD